MDSRRWREIESLLEAALDRPDHERDAFVRDAAGEDQELLRELRSLLAAGESPRTFLERPAVQHLDSDLQSTTSVIPGDPPVGMLFSHYRLERKLGEGGMGIIYKAFDIRLHRPVALKFLSGKLAGRDAGMLARLTREARAASALNHPNICTIYDIGEAEGRHFIAMEYLEGASLAELLTHETGRLPLDLKQLLSWALQITDALDAAHQAGIVHRDMKPANVFITARNQAKVLDFGLAKSIGNNMDHANPALTVTGAVMGTVAYMSPEQLQGKPVDTRSDLFSLGVMLFEMVTGVRPFTGDTQAAVFGAILHTPAPDPRTLNPAVPSDLADIIGKCLDKNLNDRAQSASEVREALQKVLMSPAQPAPTHKARTKYSVPSFAAVKTRASYALIGLAAAGLILAAILYLQSGDEPDAVQPSLQNAGDQPTRATQESARETSDALWSLYYLGRLEEAEKRAQAVRDQNPHSEDLDILLFQLAFLNKDWSRMESLASEAQGSVASAIGANNVSALAAAARGRLGEANEIWSRTLELAKRSGGNDRVALLRGAAAVSNALLGDPAVASAYATDVGQVSHDGDEAFAAAVAFVLAGDTRRASQIMRDLARSHPKNSSVQGYYLPTLNGLIAWKQKAPKKALEGFEPTLVNEYAVPTLTLNGHYGALYSAYFRGLAYLDLRQPAAAVAELEKLRTHSQLVGCDPIGSLARLQLGRAYVQLGDEDRAEEAYDDFLKLWEEADVNLPILTQARAEYDAIKH